RYASLHEFLSRELPPGQTPQADYLTEAIAHAGERYDRYSACREEWRHYSARRSRLTKIADHATLLASELGNLDLVSRDNLAHRDDPRQLEALIGSLHFLHKAMTDMAKGVQRNGRSRELAEEQ